MNILEILLNCARADLAYALGQAERTCDAAWQHQAADARDQMEAIQAMMVSA